MELCMLIIRENSLSSLWKGPHDSLLCPSFCLCGRPDEVLIYEQRLFVPIGSPRLCGLDRLTCGQFYCADGFGLIKLSAAINNVLVNLLLSNEATVMMGGGEGRGGL